MKTQHIAAAILALAASAAQAAPFATTHQGTISIGVDPIPGLASGQPWSLTLVMDNGSTDADNGTWEPQHLTCAIWRMGNAPQIIVAQDMALAPADAGLSSGALETNSTGDTVAMFTTIVSGGIPAAATRTRGLPPGEALGSWHAATNNSPMLYTVPNNLRLRGPGGVQMNPADWSQLQPFTGNCLDAAGPASAGGNVAAVPTLGHAALALLGALVGGLGLRAKRRDDS